MHLKPITVKPCGYVLKCEGEHYYCGITLDFNKRWSQHCSKDGSLFTSLFPPVSVYSIEMDVEGDWENQKVLELMKTFGIQNVRGGSWCKLELSDKVLDGLQERIGCMECE